MNHAFFGCVDISDGSLLLFIVLKTENYFIFRKRHDVLAFFRLLFLSIKEINVLVVICLGKTTQKTFLLFAVYSYISLCFWLC